MVVTAQLKKECDARAIKIVEFSIEGKLRSEVFTRCLPFINQSHYQDIVEERAITKLCGYSLCGKHIPDMPKKQYFISTKSNKVYDITERKNFCSNFCYKASLHIKKQIDNNPLWLRKLEDIPEYKLLHSSEGGLPGDYIDQGIIKPAEEVVGFTSIKTFAQASLADLTETSKENKKAGSFKRPNRVRRNNTMQTIKETDVELVEEELSPVVPVNKGVKKLNMKKHNVVTLPAIEENEERTSRIEAHNSNPVIEEMKEHNISVIISKKEPIKPKKILKKKLSSKALDLENVVRNALESWITIETFIFIHGEDKVRQTLDEKKLSDWFEKLHVEALHKEQQLKYMQICRRLQLQELAEEKFDRVVVGGRKLEPLVDFKKLKEDTKEMKLKVKAFFQGDMYQQDDKNFPAQNDKTEDNSLEGPPTVLPPIDSSSQKLLRRKIFLNSLSKAVQQLLQALGSPYSSVLSDLQVLAKTFHLRANNITFKPLIWTYIALVLLHLLAIRDDFLRDLLEERRSQEYIQLLFEALPGQRNFVSDVLEHAKNMELFVEQYITKDCDEV
ncbi:RNA polymerase II subunit B1 CTD phosphatase Rpap2 isoform X2 [Euwallacea fornicatus]